MESFFNVELARNPYNWIVLFLMVAIAGLALHVIALPSQPLFGGQ